MKIKEIKSMPISFWGSEDPEPSNEYLATVELPLEVVRVWASYDANEGGMLTERQVHVQPLPYGKGRTMFVKATSSLQEMVEMAVTAFFE